MEKALLEVLSHAPELTARLKSWEAAACASSEPWLDRLRSDSIETRTAAAGEVSQAGADGKAAALALIECLVWRPERPRTGRLEIMRWNMSVRGLVVAAGQALARLGQPAVAVFQAILNSSDKSFAAHGSRLRDVRDPGATPELMSCLTSANPLARSCAAEALGGIRSTAAILPLAAALRDSAEAVRAEAARALVGIGGEDALQQLLEGLKDANEGAREASRVLGKVRDKKMSSFFVAALTDDSGLVVEQAAQALGRSRETTAIESLLGAAVHPWPAAAGAALASLKAIDPDWPESAAARAAELELTRALISEDAAVRRHAASVLALVKPDAGTLLQALQQEPNADVRAGIAKALAAAADPLTVDPLLEVLAAETDDAARIQLVRALGSLGDAAAVESLTALINPEDKPSSRLVNAVVDALGSMGSRRAVPALVEVLTAARFNLPSARSAAKALGRIGGDEATVALQAVQQSHWSDNTRGAGFIARDAKEALAQLQIHVQSGSL